MRKGSPHYSSPESGPASLLKRPQCSQSMLFCDWKLGRGHYPIENEASFKVLFYPRLQNCAEMCCSRSGLAFKIPSRTCHEKENSPTPLSRLIRLPFRPDRLCPAEMVSIQGPLVRAVKVKRLLLEKGYRFSISLLPISHSPRAISQLVSVFWFMRKNLIFSFLYSKFPFFEETC